MNDASRLNPPSAQSLRTRVSACNTSACILSLALYTQELPRVTSFFVPVSAWAYATCRPKQSNRAQRRHRRFSMREAIDLQSGLDSKRPDRRRFLRGLAGFAALGATASLAAQCRGRAAGFRAKHSRSHCTKPNHAQRHPCDPFGHAGRTGRRSEAERNRERGGSRRRSVPRRLRLRNVAVSGGLWNRLRSDRDDLFHAPA